MKPRVKRDRLLGETPLGEPRTEGGATKQDVLKVEVAYDLGGMNHFTGSRDPRGYVLRVRPVTLESTVLDGRTYKMESFMLFSGVKAFIEPAQAFSAKRLAAIVPDPALIEKLTAHVLAARAKEALTKEVSPSTR
jgi:hypothetical protein